MSAGGRGRRCILLVENDALQAMDAADTLQAAGYSVLGPAATLEDGFRLAAAASTVDAALLNIRVDGQVFALADWLRERGVPIAFVTGYQSEGMMPDRFMDCAVLIKPWQSADLLSTVARLIGSSPAGD